ncbi:MAG: hypothetical protein KJ606_09090 [Chloroflexi bacterium]|nr:hypothetical protein [Chloroflexota bacterium]
MIEQARKAIIEVGGVVEVTDISDKPELAAHYRLFFPFMTVIDDIIRLSSPIPAERLVKVVREGVATEPAIFQLSGPELKAEMIEPLTIENMGDTCPLCIPSSEATGCQAKQVWASMVKDEVQEGLLGFIAYDGGKAVGVVEFLPATVIPYPLPKKDSTIAFITCIYSPSDGFGTDQGGEADYRGQVLDHLLDYLPRQGYKKVQVIAGRRTPYPNGPVPFFLSHGFNELSELDKVVLTVGEDELVLMEKDIAFW